MADVDRCVCCGEIVPEGRMVCPQCEFELQSKPDVGAVLDIEDKIDDNLISEDWIKFFRAHPDEFCKLCGIQLTFAQRVYLRIISSYEKVKDRGKNK